MPSDLAAHVENFFHTVSRTRAKIEFQSCSRIELIEGKQMSVGQIVDMDVVSNTSSIVCRVVFAK